jgi:hypothetical protein
MDMAGENINGHGATRSTVGFDDLPYFQDYLKDVLRPRIERALEAVDKSMTEWAWRQVIAALAAEQGTPEIAAALLRPLLEGKLGLKIETKLTSQFGNEAATRPEPVAQPAPAGAVDLESEGVARTPGGPEVMVRRRPNPANPLVNAVMSSGPRPPVR